MKFEPSRAAAIEKLNNFIVNGLVNYSRLRSFDFGPDKRTNISCLSPYISHGILNEIEVFFNFNLMDIGFISKVRHGASSSNTVSVIF